MDSNILFELSKYIDGDSEESPLSQAHNSPESKRRKREHVRDYLEKRLGKRPSVSDLERRNIMQKDPLSFRRIHEMLSTINFSARPRGRQVAPSIASRAKRLDFCIKRRIIVEKLGLRDMENMYGRPPKRGPDGRP